MAPSSTNIPLPLFDYWLSPPLLACQCLLHLHPLRLVGVGFAFKHFSKYDLNLGNCKFVNLNYAANLVNEMQLSFDREMKQSNE